VGLMGHQSPLSYKAFAFMPKATPLLEAPLGEKKCVSTFMNRLSYATYSFPYLREQFQIQMHIQTVLPALLEKTEHISCSGGMEYNLVTVLNFKIHCLLETASSRWLGRAIRSSRSSCWTPRRISKPMILSENGDMQPHSGRTLCMSTNIFLSARPFAIRCGVCTSKEKSNIQKRIESNCAPKSWELVGLDLGGP